MSEVRFRAGFWLEAIKKITGYCYKIYHESDQVAFIFGARSIKKWSRVERELHIALSCWKNR